MTKYNYFLVDSPLQYLNAEEALFQMGLMSKLNILIVFQGSSLKNLRQIKNIHNVGIWHKTYFLKHNQKDIVKYWIIPVLNYFIWRFKPYRVFIGEYRSQLMRHFINRGKPNECYLLDDGNASLFIHDLIRKKTGVDNRHLINRIMYFLFDVKAKDIFNIRFFTVYAQESDTQHIHNNYGFIKKKAEDYTHERVIYFLGNNLVELEIMHLDTYLKYIEKSLKELKRFHSKVLYIPHRREKQEKIKSIQKMYDIEILSLDLPIEAYISRTKIIPRVLCSFFSSALDNCYFIYKDKLDIISFKVRIEDISGDYKLRVTKNYEFYEKYYNSFEIIDISNLP